MTSLPTKMWFFIAALSILFSIVVHFSFQLLTPNEKSKIVHFDNALVFSKFNMSKEMQALGIKKLNPQKKKVDSLVTLLQQKSPDTNTNNLEKLFIAENNKLKTISEEISSQSNYQVWSRINQYAQDFGENNGYDLILGTTGNGNVMYAKSALDVTEDFIVFANTKYED